ncbi:MAG: DUF5674 family protein [Nitrospinota bacterium]
MEIINSRITKKELGEKSLHYFKTFIKVVVDIEKEIIALDAELHSDLEAYLLESGSKQENLWGINLYPLNDKENFIEFTSLINIRPHQDNYSMEITSSMVKEKIKGIVDKHIYYEA